MVVETLFAFLPTTFVLLGSYVLVSGVSKVRTALALPGIEGRQTIDVGDGYAFLRGTAESGGSTVTAPLPGTECLGYRVAVQHWDARPERTGPGQWNAQDTDRDLRPFRVSDDTGPWSSKPTTRNSNSRTTTST